MDTIVKVCVFALTAVVLAGSPAGAVTVGEHSATAQVDSEDRGVSVESTVQLESKGDYQFVYLDNETANVWVDVGEETDAGANRTGDHYVGVHMSRCVVGDDLGCVCVDAQGERCDTSDDDDCFVAAEDQGFGCEN